MFRLRPVESSMRGVAEEGFEGEACLPSQGSVSYDTGRLALIFSPAAITGRQELSARYPEA